MIVQVERADERDLPLFERMEQDPDTRGFITPYSLDTHATNFAKADVVYLRILADGRLAGFFILVLDPDGRSVEFRRVVVAAKGAGIGQLAIQRMEEFCREEMGRRRIWLDVFEHNARGRHVYEKLGYRRFDSGELDGKPLLLYEKQL
jgi:RimJ/RimL family protein N-acetyltransferase